MLTGVVFVIDCHDVERLSIAREELLNLSDKLGRSSSIPIVIAANKQDLSRIDFVFFLQMNFYIFSFFEETLTKEDLIRALAIPKVTSNEWKIFELSAHTGN